MPEGSLSVSIQDLQGALAAVTDLLGAAPEGDGDGSGLAGGAALAAASPSAEIGGIGETLTSLTSGLLDIDTTDLGGIGGLFTTLQNQVQGGPTAALDGFSGLIGAADGAFGGDVLGQLQSALDALRGISASIPEDPGAIVSTLLDQVLRILASLDGPEAQQLNAWAQNLASMHRTLMPLIEQADTLDDPAAAVAEVFRRAMESVLDAFGYREIAGLATKLGAFADGALPEARLQALGGALDGVFAGLGGVQAAVSADFPAFRGSVTTAISGIQSLKAELRPVLGVLHQIIEAPIFQPGALEALLRERLEAALGVRVQQIQRIDDPFNALFDRIDAAIDGVDLSIVRTQLLDFMASTRDTLEQVDIPSLGDLLGERLATVEDSIGQLEQGLTGLLDQIRAWLDGLTGQLDGLTANLGSQGADGRFHYRFEADLRDTLEQARLAVAGDPDDPGAASVAGSLGDIQTRIDQFIGQLTGVLEPVDTAIADAVTTAENGIDTFVGYLEGLQIPELMETLRGKVAEIVDALLPIDFTLVIEPVVGAIDDTSGQLREIDTESLNDLLKEALKVALQVIVEIDFTVTITNPLSDQLAAIKAIPQQALEQLQQRYEQALSLLDGLDPQRLLEALFAAFDVIRDAANALDPAALLAPLDALHAQYLQQPLAQLRPSALLEPASVAFRGATASLDGIDGSALIAPLDGQLQGLKDRVADLDVTGWIDDLSGAVGSVQDRVRGLRPSELLAPLSEQLASLEDVLGRFRPSVLLAPATELAAPLLTLLEDIQQGLIDTLFEMFQAPLRVLDSLEPEALAQRIRDQIDTLLAALRALNLPTRYNQLKGQYFDLTAGVEAQGVEARLALSAHLDPELQLGELMQIYNRSLTALEGLKQNVALPDLGDVYSELRERLLGMLPPYARELLDPETFRRIMRLADPTRFVAELDQRYDALIDRLLPISPAEIGAELDATYDSLLALVDQLDIGPALDQVRDGLDRVKGIVETIRVDFVAGDIDAAIGELRALIDALDPAALAAPLDEIHADLTQVVADTRPSVLLASIGEPLGQLQALLDRVDPRASLAPPLDTAWEAVLGHLAEIDFRVVLSPLVDKLDQLEADFIACLGQTEEAFDRLLGAAQGALSGGGSAGGSISVGGSI
jgi:hypothetical protein